MKNIEGKCPECGGEVTDANRTEIGGRKWCSQKCWTTMMEKAGEESSEKTGTPRRAVEIGNAPESPRDTASPAVPYWLERLLVYYGDGHGKFAAIWYSRGIAVEDFERVVEEVKRLQRELEESRGVTR